MRVLDVIRQPERNTWRKPLVNLTATLPQPRPPLRFDLRFPPSLQARDNLQQGGTSQGPFVKTNYMGQHAFFFFLSILSGT